MNALKISEFKRIDFEDIYDANKKMKQIEKLMHDQYLSMINLYHYYLEKEVLEQAEKQLFQEIDDIEQSLVAETDLTILMHNNLSYFLLKQHRSQKAK
jgi:hypothetical protein